MLNRQTLSSTGFSFLFFFGFSFLLYANTLGHGFVWDDFAVIVRTDVFRQWENLPKFFTTPYWYLLNETKVPYHRPFLPLWILIVSTFSGLKPFGYHLFGVLLQSLNGWLFFQVLRKLPVSQWVIWAAAILFMVHPIHVEAVAWINGHIALIGACWYLLALWFSLAQFQHPDKPNLALSLLFVGFGLLSYHAVWTYPVVLIVLHRWSFSGNWKDLWKNRRWEYFGIIILFLIYGLYAKTAINRMGLQEFKPFYHPEITNVIAESGAWMTALNVFTRYLENLFLPLSLAPDAYFYGSALQVSSLAIFVLLSFLTWKAWQSQKTSQALRAAWLWMVISLMPVLGVVDIGGVFADRYAYISSMGFCLLAALILESFKIKMEKLILILIVTMSLLFSALTFFQNQIWQNEVRFWYEASLRAPKKARIHNQLGMALEQAGKDTEALKAYQNTIRLSPDNFIFAYQSLARVSSRLGDSAQAYFWEQEFQKRFQVFEAKRAQKAG